MATHSPVAGVTGHPGAPAWPAWPACSAAGPEPPLVAPPLAVPPTAFVAPPLATLPSEFAVRPHDSTQSIEQPIQQDPRNPTISLWFTILAVVASPREEPSVGATFRRC